MSTIWENNDGCAEQYCCATALYLLSMLSHEYNIIMDSGVGSLVHDREVVYGLNATYERFFSMLITTVQLHGAAAYDSQMVIHTSTAEIGISLAR